MKEFALPKSARIIFEVLSSSTYTTKEIHEITNIPPRTVRFAISILRERGLIIEKISFKDLRSKYCMAVKEN